MTSPQGGNVGPVIGEEHNPYRGLASFEEGDQLFGRDKEGEELFGRVQAETLTVLFGASGLGKTSLLQADLFPRLRKADYLPIPVRGLLGTRQDPLAQIRADIEPVVEADGVDLQLDSESSWNRLTLWELFHRARFWGPWNRLLTPVLVFDQFEQLFTHPPSEERREKLETELANLIENRIPASVRQDRSRAKDPLPFSFETQNYRVVFSLREDFLAELEDLRANIPSIQTNRFRLTRMNGDQATRAVLGPGSGFIRKPVARKIVEFAAHASHRRGAREGETASLGALQVEPALLSLVCRQLNQHRLVKGRQWITREDLGKTGNQILFDFYRGCLAGEGFRERWRKAKSEPVEEAKKNSVSKVIAGLSLWSARHAESLAERPPWKGRPGRLLQSLPANLGSFASTVLADLARLAWALPDFLSERLWWQHRAGRFVEDKLVTRDGFRDVKPLEGAGLPKERIARLVDRRLLRTEWIVERRYVQLIHDRLCEPVVESRKRRPKKGLKGLLLAGLMGMAFLGLIVGLKAGSLFGGTDTAEGLKKGREKGLAEGLKKGREKGLAEGLKKGREKGLAEGLKKGRAEGHAEGLAEGRRKGLDEGRRKGHRAGYDEGYEAGLEGGTKRGYDKGYKEGLASCPACPPPATDKITFEDFPARWIVSVVSGEGGAGPIHVAGFNPRIGDRVNAAVVFDSSNPTVDMDLGTPNERFGGKGQGRGGEPGRRYENRIALRKTLIIANDPIDRNQDGLTDAPPGDAHNGGKFTFDFSALGSVTIVEMTFVDIDERGTVVCLSDGSRFEVPLLGNNGVHTLSLGPTSGVRRMVVRMGGSGAIDDIVFSREAQPAGDGGDVEDLEECAPRP